MSICWKYHARIDFKLGPMGSGKSAWLIGKYAELKGRKKIVKLISSVDKDGEVKSRIGLSVSAKIVPAGSLLQLLSDKEFFADLNYIGIDEMQFYGKEELCSFCLEVLARNISIIGCALDLDYRCQWWESILSILKYADGFKKLTAPCQVCGAEAPFTGKFKHAGVDQLVEVGDIGKLYAPLCRSCYDKLAHEGAIYGRI